MTDPATITATPADEASRDDLRTVFGERGVPHDCQCQWFKLMGRPVRRDEERLRGLRLARSQQPDTAAPGNADRLPAVTLAEFRPRAESY
jgi:hypothetical protein